MRKSIEEIKKLNTRNLLSFYKAERRRFYGIGYWCSCGCGEMIWEARTSQADMEHKYNEHKDYLTLIKTELNKREHVCIVSPYKKIKYENFRKRINRIS